MKVAVVLSGHARSLGVLMEQQLLLLGGLRREHEVRLFAHTWSESEVDGFDVDASLYSLLGAEQVIVEPPVSIPSTHLLAPGTEDPKRDARVAARMAAMWLGIQRAYDLARDYERETGNTFDVFLRTRPDVLWSADTELRAFDGTPRFPRRHAANRQPSDLCFAVTADHADSVFGLYNRLPALASSYREYGYRAIIPEYVLGFALESAAMTWNAFTTDVLLVRDQGVNLWFDQDRESFAFKSARKHQAELGDGLPGGTADSERMRTDVQVNATHEAFAIDSEVIDAAPQIMGSLKEDPAETASLSLALLHRRPSPCARVYLSTVLVLAVRRSGAARRAAVRHPWTAVRALATFIGFVTRRYCRRARSSRQLGVRFSYFSLPRSNQPR